MKNERGRPSKIHDPDIVRRLLDNIRVGMPQQWAATEAGIDERTFYNWKKRAESGDPEYEDFFQGLKHAQSVGMKMNLKTILCASNPEQFGRAKFRGVWQAAAWILERRHPNEFGRDREPDELETKQEGVDMSELSEEDLSAIEAILEKYENTD